MIKYSKASKMPCYSWSLQALDTCPGSFHTNSLGEQELVDACKGCYATDGNYRFGNVIAPRKHNQEDWKRDGWANDIVELLTAKKGQRFFRWFDSGDVYHIKLARKILDVMKRTPDTQHWLPTRMHKFSKFLPVFDDMNALPNVVVRYSSDSIKGAIIKGQNTSTIIPNADDTVSDIVTVCDAYQREGKCIDCRACWDKDNQVIAYPQHGRKMAGVNKRIFIDTTHLEQAA